jgi:DNA modification methylase
MKILKGKYGECRFCDNMDAEYGLPSLAEKSWDLCLTDPPYGINYNKPSGMGEKPVDRNKIKQQYFDDREKNYFPWIKTIMSVCLEKANGLVFTSGRKYYYDWIIEFGKPKDEWIWYKKNAQNGGILSYFARHEPILIYGNINKVKESVFEEFVINGFLRNTLDSFEMIHPCPKSINFWKRLVYELNPISILDPFLGSGTTAQCCEEMGIPWLGYEIMEEYAPDIEKRIQLGIKSHKSYIKLKKHQSKLF